MADKKKPVWDPELEGLLKSAIHSGNKGIRTKSAKEVGHRAVEYFRGPDFCKWLLKNADMFKKKYPGMCGSLELTTVKDAETVGDKLIRNGFIYRAAYKPIKEQSDDEGEGDSLRRPKWPKRLTITPQQSFDEGSFYVILYEGSKTMSYILLGLMLTCVLLLCMFPAWPLSCKIGIWYCAVVLIFFLIGLIAVRLVLFVALWFFGFDFWILPNLFNEEAGFLDSFLPLYSFEWRKDDWYMVGCRFFCAIMLAGGLYQLSQTHSIRDVGDFAKDTFVDLLEWGVQKVSAIPEPMQRYASLSDIEKLAIDDNTTATHDSGATEAPSSPVSEDPSPPLTPVETFDFSCLVSCEFDVKSFEQLQEECVSDCSCAKDLMGLKCFKSCDSSLRDRIAKAKAEACAAPQTPTEEL